MRILALLGILLTASSVAAEDSVAVAAGSPVSFEFTLTLEDGTVADTSIGRAPMSITQGQNQILPGLEAALIGMQVDESKKVVLAPEQGFGPVDPEKFQEIPIERIPAENRRAGDVIIGEAPTGQKIPIRVHEVRDDVAVLDFNHPMAGQTLTFDVKIVSIGGAAPAAE